MITIALLKMNTYLTLEKLRTLSVGTRLCHNARISIQRTREDTHDMVASLEFTFKSLNIFEYSPPSLSAKETLASDFLQHPKGW